jgi:hypothetical protein
MVEVAAGDAGGQVLAAGLIDEVRRDVVPVVSWPTPTPVSQIAQVRQNGLPAGSA